MKYTQLIFGGSAEVTKKSRHRATINVTPAERVIVVDGNNVSSLSPKDTKNISDKLTKGSNCLMLLPDGKQKVAKLNKVNRISTHGVPALKFELSTDDYDTTGQFAKSAANLEDFPEGEQFEVRFIFGWNPPILRCDRNGNCLFD